VLLKGSVDLDLEEDERLPIEVDYDVWALHGTRRADGDLSLGFDLFTVHALVSQLAFAGWGQHLNEEFSLDGPRQSIEDIGERLGQKIFER